MMNESQSSNSMKQRDLLWASKWSKLVNQKAGKRSRDGDETNSSLFPFALSTSTPLSTLYRKAVAKYALPKNLSRGCEHSCTFTD